MSGPRTVLLSFALGTGHRQVAENLAAELGALGHSCEHRPLETWVPWDYDLLFRHGYLFLALRVPSVWDAMYHSPRFTRRDHLAFPIMRGRAVRAFGREGLADADLVVATQYNAMEIAADWKARRGGRFMLAAVVTDYDIYPLWARPEVDLFVVPHGDQRDLLVARGIPAGRVRVAGIAIAPAFELGHDRGETLSALGFDARSKTVLILGGGGGMGPLRESAEACLSGGGWQVIVVCGNNERLRRTMVPFAQAHSSRLRVLGYRRDIPSLMRAADAIVTKAGGLSLTEALYSGNRVIVIPSLSGQEQVNIAFMERHGWVVSCDDPRMLPGMLEGEGPGLGAALEALPRAPARLAARILDGLARA